MRIATECAFCDHSKKRPIPLDIELNDELFIKFSCDNGHVNTRFIETEKFSVLFDLGMFALEDGYSREAVASFAAAVERVQEFYVRVVCKKHSIPDAMVRAAWKLVSNQSERQLGAFSFLQLLERKTSPPAPLMVEFRNKVVHKGYIPTRAEALEYARHVHDHIVSIVAQMNSDLKDFVRAVHSDERARVTGEAHNSNMSVKNYIPFATDFTKYYAMSLDEKMSKRKSYRWLLPGSGPIQSWEHVNKTTGATLIMARKAGSGPLMIADASDLEAE
jgi:hypothetical protein